MKTYAEKKWGDCSKAVAYSLNFVQMCYSPDNVSWSEYYTTICDECQCKIQSKNFEYRKSDFSKKDYFILDYYCYGVSENLKKDMICFGLSEDNFRPIYTRKHDQILGYQIVADNILPSTIEVNGKYTFSECKKCNHKTFEVFDKLQGTKAYNGLGYPVFITEEAEKELKHINCLYENKNKIIISCQLYNYLIERYPRLECRPVFLGSVYNDKEYLRIREK